MLTLNSGSALTVVNIESSKYSKVIMSTAAFNQPHCYRNSTCHKGSHGDTWQRWHFCLYCHQLKLVPVLNLATQEWCKA